MFHEHIDIDLPDDHYNKAICIMQHILEWDEEYQCAAISYGAIDIMIRQISYNKLLPEGNKLYQDESGSLHLRTKAYPLRVLFSLLRVFQDGFQQAKKLASDFEIISHISQLLIFSDKQLGKHCTSSSDR